MKPRIVLFVVLVSLVMFSGLVLVLNQRGSLGRTGSSRSGTPKDALVTYLEAAYNGNETVVDGVAHISAANWLQDCIGTSRSEKSNFELAEMHPTPLSNAKDTPSESEDILPSFKGPNVSEDLRGFARFVFASRISPDRFRIAKTAVHEDEALLRVNLLSRTDPSRIEETNEFAFVKTADEWKIIGVFQNNAVPGNSPILYGSPRPPCKE